MVPMRTGIPALREGPVNRAVVCFASCFLRQNLHATGATDIFQQTYAWFAQSIPFMISVSHLPYTNPRGESNLRKILLENKNYTEILTHVQTMCTRPFPPPPQPGYEATTLYTLTFRSCIALLPTRLQHAESNRFLPCFLYSGSDLMACLTRSCTDDKTLIFWQTVIHNSL